MAAGDMKRARLAVAKQMKGITTIANARSRALSAAIKDLQKQGVKGVPGVLKKYGQHFTPQEKELLENATDEVIENLIETDKMLKDVNSTIECI